ALLTARDIFVEEGNEVWVAMIDLWRAQLLIRQQQFSTAQELAQKTAEVFKKQQAPARAANARVLSAQSWLELDEPAPALQEAQKALDEIEGYHAPWVSYQCYNTLGRLNEVNGATEEAEQLYLKAIDQLDGPRHRQRYRDPRRDCATRAGTGRIAARSRVGEIRLGYSSKSEYPHSRRSPGHASSGRSIGGVLHDRRSSAGVHHQPGHFR